MIVPQSTYGPAFNLEPRWEYLSPSNGRNELRLTIPASLERVDPMTQPSQSPHLQETALAELDVANRQLALAGRTIDELRSDVLALATRVDDSRAEAESFKKKLESSTEQIGSLTEQSGSLTEQNVSIKEQHNAHCATLVSERVALESTNTALEAHVTRLKRQVARPERLLVKKVLRRGPYNRPDAS